MPGQNLLRRPLRRGSYRLGKSIYCVAAAICFRIASGAADPLSAALNKVDRAVPCSMLKQMRQAANVYEAYARDRRICFRQARRRIQHSARDRTSSSGGGQPAARSAVGLRQIKQSAPRSSPNASQSPMQKSASPARTSALFRHCSVALRF